MRPARRPLLETSPTTPLPSPPTTTPADRIITAPTPIWSRPHVKESSVGIRPSEAGETIYQWILIQMHRMVFTLQDGISLHHHGKYRYIMTRTASKECP